MYRLNIFLPPETASTMVIKVEENLFIPFDLSNTDYQQFKADVLAGVKLQDTEGNVMPQEAATAFISELP